VLDISPEKLLVIMAIALAVLGPEGIPRVARALAKARATIGRLTADVPPDTVQILTNPRGALVDAMSGPRHAVNQAVAEPRSALAEAIAGFTLTGTAPAATTAPVTDGGPDAGGIAPAPDDPGLN
jgi:mttA/Hcf106 family